jgi:serine/threonine-protein kinase
MSRPQDFRRENLRVWKELLESIFPLGIPSSAAWTDLRSMSSVLNKIASHPNSNHMFYPTHGGMDLLEAFPFDEEPGCLALRTGESMVEVVRPAALLFESFGPKLEWAYFRIECQPMSPSGAYENLGSLGSEEVVLDAPGIYANRAAWDENEYEGEHLPESARLVERFFVGKPFVIFAKESIYNQASEPDAYDAQHAEISATQFKEYIKKRANIS